jgi:hypothetical protein
MCSALPPSHGSRLTPLRLGGVIAHCRALLDITQRVDTERISRFQVTDERSTPGCGLIGVVFDAHHATIYHTRVLTAEDVLHELLHVAHPDWSEAAVVQATTLGWRELSQAQGSPRERKTDLAA